MAVEASDHGGGETEDEDEVLDTLGKIVLGPCISIHLYHNIINKLVVND